MPADHRKEVWEGVDRKHSIPVDQPQDDIEQVVWKLIAMKNVVLKN